MSMEPVNSDVAAEPEEAPDAAESPAAATLGQLMLAVEELWPESLAEAWDEVGLVAGHPYAGGVRAVRGVGDHNAPSLPPLLLVMRAHDQQAG